MADISFREDSDICVGVSFDKALHHFSLKNASDPRPKSRQKYEQSIAYPKTVLYSVCKGHIFKKLIFKETPICIPIRDYTRSLAL